ncbi:MAG TPA: GMC family oxidoreductase, partial [Thermoleophilaceae bacterium]|nr:GMC family oxidoreductase [Thermoleophilaceae bacterium]
SLTEVDTGVIFSRMEPTDRDSARDYDWLVVGSGFGGSVSALRLSEKGHRVGVLESGRRYTDEDFPSSTWDLRRYYWAPRAGLRGIFRLSLFRDVSVVSGCGVGGGSLGFANTLYRAPLRFYEDPQWAGLEDWQAALAPHYDEAERMLGVSDVTADDPADRLLREFGDTLGVGHTYSKARVGVYFGEPGKTVPDPYFGGDGPARTGCTTCGRCMVGCPVGAKNTLVKNYLWFAERNGADVLPERTVTSIRPLGAGDGSEGYELTSERSGAWLRKDRRTHTARGVVLAAGALGTNLLLQRCRESGTLRISDRLGELVRTNSEAILAVTVPDDYPEDLTGRVAITSSIYPDPDTHIETVVYGSAGDSMSTLYTFLVGDGTRLTRPLKLLAKVLRHPGRFARMLDPRGWSRRTIILLVMQTLDNAIALRPKRTRLGGMRLETEQDPLRPNPTFIPVANQAAEWIAERTGGVAQSSVMEALLNVPTTAHILGGAVIAASPEKGVVDSRLRVFGYDNLMVCDGAAIPANVGVNPSLTIAALAEHAMSHVPAAGGEPAAETVGAPAP